MYMMFKVKSEKIRYTDQSKIPPDYTDKMKIWPKGSAGYFNFSGIELRMVYFLKYVIVALGKAFIAVAVFNCKLLITKF